MPNLSTIIIGAYVGIMSMGLVIGTTYLRGGSDAIRLAIPRLTILAALIVVVSFTEPMIMNAVGSMTVGVALLPVMLVTLILLLRRRNKLAADGRLAVVYTPAIRRFVIVWLVALVVGTILLSFLAAKAGY